MCKRGCSVDAAALDRKMRNMKNTYKTIVDNNRKKKTGRGTIQWEYFSRFKEIFANDKTVNPEFLVSSFPDDTINPELQDNPIEEEEISEVNSSATFRTSTPYTSN